MYKNKIWNWNKNYKDMNKNSISTLVIKCKCNIWKKYNSSKPNKYKNYEESSEPNKAYPNMNCLQIALYKIIINKISIIHWQ